MKLIVGLGQPWPRVSRHAPQRRLPGGRRDRPAAPADAGDGAVAGARNVRRQDGSAPERGCDARGQAADVHEPQRRRAWRRWRATTTSRRATCSWWSTRSTLPFGRLRARARGSAGTHNGLKSIVERLGTREFPRLRLGVGRGDARRDLADHVLSKFEPDERAELESFIARAADAAEMFAVEGIDKVMNVYNPDATGPEVD